MSPRVRRRIVVASLIICTLGVAFNLALMAAGHSSQWTVILFTVEFGGVLGSIASLWSMRGQR